MPNKSFRELKIYARRDQVDPFQFQPAFKWQASFEKIPRERERENCPQTHRWIERIKKSKKSNAICNHNK